MTPIFVSNLAAPTPSTTPEFVIKRLPNQQSKSRVAPQFINQLLVCVFDGLREVVGAGGHIEASRDRAIDLGFEVGRCWVVAGISGDACPLRPVLAWSSVPVPVPMALPAFVHACAADSSFSGLPLGPYSRACFRCLIAAGLVYRAFTLSSRDSLALGMARDRWWRA